jgi:hypothetical protein
MGGGVGATAVEGEGGYSAQLARKARAAAAKKVRSKLLAAIGCAE